MVKSYPKISVVIPSFNQGCFIEETINSVANQKYPNLELIIIDGKSKDNTIDVINKYSDSINYFVSESDNGQAHALNKGFMRATGQICCYLNSDDLFLNNILWKVGDYYSVFKFKWICSDVLFGSSLDSSHFFQRAINSYEEFCAQQTIGQQGVFWENDALQKPWFDENLQYVMDHKFFINLYRKFGRPEQINACGSFFRIHENSKTSKYEKILYAERKKIGLEAASNANSKYQRNRIILEIKRLDLKIETVKNFNKISQSKTPFNKLFFIIILILIFLKAPFKLRDFYFLGYLKKALKLLIRY